MSDIAARTTPRKGELSSEKLLEISANLFREHGYASTTMRDIAQAAGMKAGSLYYHFQSKDEILDQVLERGIAEAIRGFKAALESLGQDADFDSQFRAVVTAHLQTVFDYGTYTVASRQLLGQVPQEVRARHMAKRQEYDAMWRDLLKQRDLKSGGGSVDAGLLRLFLLGSLNWTSEWLDPTRKSIAELGAIAADLFLRGFSQPPATKKSRPA